MSLAARLAPHDLLDVALDVAAAFGLELEQIPAHDDARTKLELGMAARGWHPLAAARVVGGPLLAASAGVAPTPAKSSGSKPTRGNPGSAPRRLPVTRGDCLDAPRPCHLVRCRHHLALEVERHGRRALKIVGGVEEIDLGAMAATCALDVVDANPDGATLDAVADLFGLTRQAIQNLEARAMRRVRRAVRLGVGGLKDYA